MSERIAGRPALHELKETQREALEALREGLSTEQEVTDWLFQVSKASLGFLDKDTKELLRNRILHNLLVMRGKPWYPSFIEALAKRVSRAFDEATREIATRSGEERDKPGVQEADIKGGESYGI